MIELECKCGGRLSVVQEHDKGVTLLCEKCKRRFYYRN